MEELIPLHTVYENFYKHFNLATQLNRDGKRNNNKISVVKR